MDEKRRQLLAGISLAGAGVLLNACRNTPTRTGSATNDENKNEGPAPGEAEPVEVTATEDLMREHGILRRALLVYQESAVRLRQDAASVPPDALEKAANLFRVFGEDYHEKKLEEVYIFPAVKKSPGRGGGVRRYLVGPARTRARDHRLLVVDHKGRSRFRRIVLSRWRKRWSRLCGCTSIMRRLKTRLMFPAWKAAVGRDGARCAGREV